MEWIWLFSNEQILTEENPALAEYLEKNPDGLYGMANYEPDRIGIHLGNITKVVESEENLIGLLITVIIHETLHIGIGRTCKNKRTKDNGKRNKFLLNEERMVVKLVNDLIKDNMR